MAGARPLLTFSTYCFNGCSGTQSRQLFAKAGAITMSPWPSAQQGHTLWCSDEFLTCGVEQTRVGRTHNRLLLHRGVRDSVFEALSLCLAALIVSVSKRSRLASPTRIRQRVRLDTSFRALTTREPVRSHSQKG